MFGMMTNLWKVFFCSPTKVKKLKEVQAVLNLLELKIVKPIVVHIGCPMSGVSEPSGRSLQP